MALMRLQDTYNLDIEEISEGKILGKNYSSSLTGIRRTSFIIQSIPDYLFRLLVAEHFAF